MDKPLKIIFKKKNDGAERAAGDIKVELIIPFSPTLIMESDYIITSSSNPR